MVELVPAESGLADFAMGPALLFCPADRPERFSKAAERADAVILDLEDAVAPDARDFAHEAMAVSTLDPDRTIVRVNPLGTPELARDLRALRRTPYRTVMLAKTEGVAGLHELADYAVIALVETAAGVASVAQIAAAPNIVGLMWGAEDLVASLGGTSSRHADGRYRQVAMHARSSVLIAAGAHRKAAIDAVYVNIPDVDGLSAEASDAAASGFSATACIHPSQVPVIRQAYLPSHAELEWARAVLAAAATERGVFQWNGQMVDEPVLRHARRLLHAATPAR